jgi:hypothetical protein
MTDNPDAARAAAAAELRQIRDIVRSMNATDVVADLLHAAGPSGCPDGDGEGMLIPLTIGARGRLSKAEADWAPSCGAKRSPATRGPPS